MFGVDWKILSLLVMVFLGVYSVALRKFFTTNGDWRMVLPLVGIIGIAAILYFAYSYKEIRFDSSAISIGAIVVIAIGIASIASLVVYADPQTSLNVAMPIMALSIVSTAVLSMMFLGETITLQTGFGMALALIAIVILSA